MPAPSATGITASGNITAPAIAPIVSITPAVLTPETMAEFSSAFEQIMGDTAVDDLSGYTVETFGRSARAASL
jgi:hypothetical protein